MAKKVIAVIFDGLGDRPIKEFGGKTPLQHAKTPNLDKIAEKSQCGLMWSLGRGIRPGSDVSHLEIFGYPISQYYTGRGPIEAAGLGIELTPGDVALRGNFATVDDSAVNIVDRRAGRIRNVDEFAAAVDGMEIDGIKFLVKAGTAHRVCLVLRGKGLSSAISDNDPHEEGKPVYTVRPLDASKEAAFTAQILNKFFVQSHKILRELPSNKQRAKDGVYQANCIIFRGAGMFPSMPKFSQKYGLKACCIAGGGLYKGIGAFLGMDLIEVKGATALPDTDIAAKFKKAVELLNDYDFIFVHVKAADSLAEDGNFAGKKDFIERIDAAAAILKDLPDGVLLAMTADHSTACALKAHTADPVPVLFCGDGVRVDDVREFNEIAFAKGGYGFSAGKDFMPQIMNLLGKLPLIGA